MSETLPFFMIDGARFFRTRHTRRDTANAIRYMPADSAPFEWRQINCVLTLLTPDAIEEKPVDRALRSLIDGGGCADRLFGEIDPEDFYRWKVIDTQFNFEPLTSIEGEWAGCAVIVEYSAWEKIQ